MKIARFADSGGQLRYGILQARELELIEGDVFGNWKPNGLRIGLEQVLLSSPVDPPNVICLGKNFRAFPGDEKPGFPKTPLIFIKSNTSVIGPEAAIMLPSIAPDEVYYEAELAVIIGRRARNVPESESLKCVFGYTVANDVGARDCQAADGQWARAKSFDTFCPLGPWIETELNPGNCRVSSRVNGVVMQDSNTALMVFNVAQAVSFLSRCMTLLPGTVICMGSPGVLQEPRPLLRSGDLVETEVGGIGVLVNPVGATS